MSKEIHTWFLKGGACSMDEKGKPILFAKQGVLVHNGIISVGYSAKEKAQGEINKIHNFSEYQEHYKKILNWKDTPMYYLYDKMDEGDIIWTRVSGSIYPEHEDGYFVAIVGKKQFYFYDTFSDAKNIKDADCLVGLKGIKWVGPFSEDEIPGSITRYIRGKTIVRVDSKEELKKDNNGDEWTYTSIVSYFLLRDKFRESNFPIDEISFDKKNIDKKEFFKLIGWSGLEDVTALWIQKECSKIDRCEYYLLPSTCKIGTVSYEYVLADSKSDKKIFVQTKNNPEIELNTETYRKVLTKPEDEFYLVTTGTITTSNGTKLKDTIVVLNKDASKDKYIEFNKLVDFVFANDDGNDNILPAHIVKCKKYLFD